MGTPNINQFAQTPVDGQLDLSQVGGNVFAARVSNNIGNGITLIPGQAVKGDNAAPATNYDGIFPVLPLASNDDPCLGFVKYSIKDINYPANSRLELATDGTIMYKISDSTIVGISRFAPVEYNIAANTVVAWQGVNPIVGYALDAAILAGDMIRIKINSPQISSSNTAGTTRIAQITATLAQINAGLVLIPGLTGKKIIPLNVVARVVGAFATGTSVELEDTSGSPVAVLTYAEAGLTNGAVLFPNSANVTAGAGFAAALTSGAGLQVVNNGSAQTAGTSITFTITFTQA